jgi:thiol-disulfide isomerase/thioredoxin
MRKITVAVVYTALALLANSVVADTALPTAAVDIATIATLRDGDMRKLMLHDEPIPASDVSFVGFDDSNVSLSDYAGQIVLVNFWATWCAPCRQEMPHLSALQAAMGSEDFQVVTIATGRNALPAIERFFDEIGVDNLPLHRDPQQELAHEMGVMGLPVSVLLNRDGQEIGRLIGDADWSSPSAIAIINTLVATP